MDIRKKQQKALSRRKIEIAKKKERRARLLPGHLLTCKQELDKLHSGKDNLDFRHSVEALLSEEQKMDLLCGLDPSMDLCFATMFDDVHSVFESIIEIFESAVKNLTKEFDQPEQIAQDTKTLEPQTRACLEETEWLIKTLQSWKLHVLSKIHTLDTYLANSESPSYSFLGLSKKDSEHQFKEEVEKLRSYVARLDDIHTELRRNQFRIAKRSKDNSLNIPLRHITLLNIQSANRNEDANQHIETQVESTIGKSKESIFRISKILLTLEE